MAISLHSFRQKTHIHIETHITVLLAEWPETFKYNPLKRFILFPTHSKQVWSEEEINIVNLHLAINWRRVHLAHRL
jgi:hypothetical protein